MGVDRKLTAGLDRRIGVEGDRLINMSERDDLRKLIQDLAIVRGRVVLSSGTEADFYVDLRRLTLHHAGAPLVGQVMLDLVDGWEFDAISKALKCGLPILAICRGIQVLNVALGGTLKLDIPGHRLPEQKEQDIQSLRYDGKAKHRFENVNSSHHQAIDRLADGFSVEAWCVDESE